MTQPHYKRVLLKVSGEGKLQLLKKTKLRNIKIRLLRGDGSPTGARVRAARVSDLCEVFSRSAEFPAVSRPAEAGRAGSPRFSEAREPL